MNQTDLCCGFISPSQVEALQSSDYRIREQTTSNLVLSLKTTPVDLINVEEFLDLLEEILRDPNMMVVQNSYIMLKSLMAELDQNCALYVRTLVRMSLGLYSDSRKFVRKLCNELITQLLKILSPSSVLAEVVRSLNSSPPQVAVECLAFVDGLVQYNTIPSVLLAQFTFYLDSALVSPHLSVQQAAKRFMYSLEFRDPSTYRSIISNFKPESVKAVENGRKEVANHARWSAVISSNDALSNGGRMSLSRLFSRVSTSQQKVPKMPEIEEGEKSPSSPKQESFATDDVPDFEFRAAKTYHGPPLHLNPVMSKSENASLSTMSVTFPDSDDLLDDTDMHAATLETLYENEESSRRDFDTSSKRDDINESHKLDFDTSSRRDDINESHKLDFDTSSRRDDINESHKLDFDTSSITTSSTKLEIKTPQFPEILKKQEKRSITILPRKEKDKMSKLLRERQALSRMLQARKTLTGTDQRPAPKVHDDFQPKKNTTEELTVKQMTIDDITIPSRSSFETKRKKRPMRSATLDVKAATMKPVRYQKPGTKFKDLMEKLHSSEWSDQNDAILAFQTNINEYYELMDTNSREMVQILAECGCSIRTALAKNALSLLLIMIRDPRIDCTTAGESAGASLLHIVSAGRQFISAIACDCFDSLVECMNPVRASAMLVAESKRKQDKARIRVAFAISIVAPLCPGDIDLKETCEKLMNDANQDVRRMARLSYDKFPQF